MTTAEERARKRAIRRRKEARVKKVVRCIKYAVYTFLIMVVMLAVAVCLTGVLFQNVQRTVEMLVLFTTWAVGMWLFAKVFEREDKHREGR